MSSGPSFLSVLPLVQRLRGFDMDDDAEQLARCTALAAADELTAAGWQFLGVLRYRAGHWAEAAAAFERAATDPEHGLHGRFLAAHARLRSGDIEGGLKSAPELTEASEEVPASLLLRLRAEGLWLKGDLAGAEATYQQAQEHPAADGVWFDLGLLREARGDRAGATSALEKAQESDPDLHQASYALAALHAAAGDTEKALAQLDKALLWDKVYAARAQKDARFAPLHEHAEFVRRVTQPAPPDAGWLSAHPALAALRDDATLRELGVRFHSQKESEEGGSAIEERYAQGWHLGVLWSDRLWQACQQAAQGKKLLATCGEVWNRSGHEIAGQLYFDPARPTEIWYAGSSEVPPVLWLPVAAEPGAVAALLGRYYPPRRVSRLELPSVQRAFLGYVHALAVPSPYSGQLEAAGPHELDRHFTFSPFVDPFGWGGASQEEPWPDKIPPQPGYTPKIVAWTRRVRQQAEGSVARITYRTLFSRSQLAIEMHRGGLYVIEIRYRPQPEQEVIRRFNEVTGYPFPTDLPFDVVGALHGFAFGTAEQLESLLTEAETPPEQAEWLTRLAAVQHYDLRITERLRSAFHASGQLPVQAAVVNACIDYGWEFLLEDLAMGLESGQVREFIERLLAKGISPPAYNEMGEPPDIYDAVQSQDGAAAEEESN